MKRVALVTHGGLLKDGRGFHVPFLDNLIRRLSHLTDLTVYTLTPPGGTPGETAIDAARVRFLPPTIDEGGMAKLSATLRAVTNDHRHRKFDLVHGIWGLPSGLITVALSRLCGIPSVVSLHGAETAALPDISYGNLAQEPHRWLTLRVIRGASALILLSKTQLKTLESLGVHRPGVWVIPPATTLKDPPEPKERFVGTNILSVASITPVKNIPFLLEVFALIARTRETRLRIVGADYSHGEARNLADSLGIADRVEFTGYVPHERMGEHYGWADLLLVTSRHEAFPLAVAEAASAGLLVIGTPVGGVLDLDGAGALAISVTETEGFAAGVLKVLDDDRLVSRIRSGGRAWSRGRTIETVAGEILSVYESVTSEPRQKPR